MSCGGNSKDNANQAAVQAAIAPFKGVMSSRDGAKVFHQLAADERAVIMGAEHPDSESMTREQGKDITHRAHARARASLPGRVREIAVRRGVAASLAEGRPQGAGGVPNVRGANASKKR